MQIKKGSAGAVEVGFFFEDRGLEGPMADKVGDLWKKERFKGASGESKTFIDGGGEGIVLLGLGKRENFTHDALRVQAYRAYAIAEEYRVESLLVYLPLETEAALQGVVEGMLQGEYIYEVYKTKKKPERALQVNLFGAEALDVDGMVVRWKTILEGVFMARDLVNAPPIDLYPKSYAEKIEALLEPVGVGVEIYDKSAIEAMGMKAFLAVSMGSPNEPKFIVLKYTPLGEEVKGTGLVGKGLTYDSGGYHLKPLEGMALMKMDMAGSAAVVGTLYALAKNKVQKNVYGVIAACENLISGSAYKNGDVISSMKGTTIEVTDTDAEGRLTLADALYYTATRLPVDRIIDLATLTGSCIAAFGPSVGGAYYNDKRLYDRFFNACEKTGDKVWDFPRLPEVRKILDSEIADIKNDVDIAPGAIIGGVFLEEFVEGLPWMHLDIAGPAYHTEAKGYLPVGGSGYPVRALVALLSDAD